MPAPSKELIIVGVDPGTTTGLAALDLDGNVVAVASRRDFSTADVISCIMDTGVPLVVAADLNPPPRKVEKIAAAFEARLSFPDDAVDRREKAEVVAALGMAWKNQHEKDAAAAAVFAYKKYKHTLAKVKRRLERDGISNMRGDVSRGVILGGRNIKAIVRDLLGEGER